MSRGLLRAFIRMYIEVGACAWAFMVFEDTALGAVSLLAAYHTGAAAYRVAERRMNRAFDLRHSVALLGMGSMCAGYAYVSSITIAVGLSLFGFGIATREIGVARAKAAPPTTKIAAKAVGMVAAALVGIHTVVYLGIAVLVTAAIVASEPPGRAYPARQFWRGWLDCTNTFHQAGYFAFCFVFWQYLPAIKAVEIAFLFPVGWLAYWALELRLAREGAPYRAILLAKGHLAFATSLLAMTSAAGHALIVLGMWFMTGLFGGTCYTMQRAPGGAPSGMSDDLGALLGSLSAMLGLMVFGSHDVPIFMGAGFAILAAICAMGTRKTAVFMGGRQS